MTLSDLAAIGSFISGIGVLVSLIYLAFQVRQNTMSHRATAYQSRLEFLRDQFQASMDPEMMALRLRVEAGDENLTELECELYLTQGMSWFIGNDHLVWLHANKILDDAQFQSEENVLLGRMTEPGTRATWSLYRLLASPALRKRLDQYMADREPAQAIRFGELWRAAWMAERKRLARSAATASAPPA